MNKGDQDNDFNLHGMLTITDQEFKLLSDLIYKQFGIHLTDAKRGLLVRRLQNLVKQKQYGSFKNYYQHLI